VGKKIAGVFMFLYFVFKFLYVLIDNIHINNCVGLS
jgi:hypothetical protein